MGAPSLLGGLLAGILGVTGTPSPTTSTPAPTPPPASSSPSPSTPTSSAKPAPKPKVGECRAMSWSVLMSDYDTSAVVPCGKSHTAIVIATPKLPANVNTHSATADQLAADAVTACAAPAHRWFKGATTYDRFVHTLQEAVYIPSSAQLAAGARWVECDVVDFLSSQSKTLPLPRKLPRPIFKHRLSDRTTICWTATSPVTCDHRHLYRPAGPLVVHHSKPLTQTQFDKKAQQCARVVHGAPWAAIRPSDLGWENGYRFIVCLKKTRH